MTIPHSNEGIEMTQEEIDNVDPVYGTLRPVSTWNPIIINFKHFLYKNSAFADIMLTNLNYAKFFS